jgi:hypothetical protein
MTMPTAIPTKMVWTYLCGGSCLHGSRKHCKILSSNDVVVESCLFKIFGGGNITHFFHWYVGKEYMSFELSTVWDDLPSSKPSSQVIENGNSSRASSGEVGGEMQLSARSSSTVTDDVVQLQKILIQEIVLLRTQSQKKDMMFTTGALIMFAILLNYIDRLHYRFHCLELQGRR